MAHELKMGDDGIIRGALMGNIGEADMVVFVKDVKRHLEANTSGKPISILQDAQRVGKFSLAARRQLTELADDPRLGRLAIINSTNFDRVIATFMMNVAGRMNDLSFFDTEAEAIAWLKEAGD
jgi:hypothetical protein